MCNNCTDVHWLYGHMPIDNNPIFKNLGVKVATPSDIEIELSARRHRWRKLADEMEKFDTSTGRKVVEAEIDGLKLFGLPDITQVERFIADPDFQEPKLKPVEITAGMKRGYKRIVGELQEDLIGESKLKKAVDLSSLPIFQYFLLNQFSASIDEILKDIKKNNPDVEAALIEAARVAPQLDNFYLQATITDSLKRVKTELALQNYDKVLSNLIRMVKEEKTPYQMASYFHKNYKGKLWYWRRLTRSESTMAIDNGASAQFAAAGIRYEVWSAAGNACPICSAFNGMQWRVGEGPHPVSDTHPHCMCLRSGRYASGTRRVLPKWNRRSPYEQYYTPDELAGLRRNIELGNYGN